MLVGDACELLEDQVSGLARWPKVRNMVQLSLYKCYPCKRYNFIYVEKILLPYKNTIGKISECYVLSVITCFTSFFVKYTFISVNLEKIKVTIVCQCGKFQKILVKWSLLANIQVGRTVTRPTPCQVDEVRIFILVVSML